MILLILMAVGIGVGIPSYGRLMKPAGGPSGDAYLQEDGASYYLLESGDYLLKE